jgi:hypothetical protein
MMKNNIVFTQSIMWAAAILVTAIVPDTQSATLLLTVLATVAILSLRKARA